MDLFWLAATAVLTSVLWIPYVINRFRELGPPGWAWFPRPDPPPRAAWAQRAVQAHTNAVENLVIFAPLALIAHTLGVAAIHTCEVFFFARLAHTVITWSGLPIPLRTLAFLIGFACQVILGVTILHAL
jgi:uncharacterized MAPEG superfamily protein